MSGTRTAALRSAYLSAKQRVLQKYLKIRPHLRQTAAQFARRQYRFALKRNGEVRRDDRVGGAM